MSNKRTLTPREGGSKRVEKAAEKPRAPEMKPKKEEKGHGSDKA